MVFPDDRTELRIDGAWTDVTDYVYARDAITITGGLADEGTRADPGKCTLTLNNRGGRFSPRNPSSPYYGLIGRNTPIRVSVPAAGTFLELDGDSTNFATTPDASALDITGDLDVRVEATMDWNRSDIRRTLIGKWAPTDGQRSWTVWVLSGFLYLIWTTGGTVATALNASLPLPKGMPKHSAIRIALDVSNSGSHSITMYTAPTLDGPWVAIAPTASATGTTSIFSSTAPLTIAPSSTDFAPNALPIAGRIHRAEVRSGIGGTVVAAPNFTTQTVGARSFTDSAGRPWTLQADAAISDRDYLFTGEVSSWPAKWDLSGNDVYTPIEAGGILRRLGQGRKPLASTLARRLPTSANLLAYWPMEEGSDATQANSPVPGVAPLQLSNVTWGSVTTLPSSGPLPALNGTSPNLTDMSGPVPAPKGTTSGWLVKWVYRLDTAPTSLFTYMRIMSTGTGVNWYIQFMSNQSRIIAKDANGDDLVNQLVTTGSDLFGQWNAVAFSLSQSGGTVTWKIVWQDVGGDAGSFSGTYSGTIGHVTAVASPPDGFSSSLNGMALGHIAVFSTPTTTAFDGAITGYAGETALNRLLRLSGETGIPVTTLDGDITMDSTAMGPQLPSPVLDLLYECADADNGVLYEAPDYLSLVYRDRSTLYNQTPVLDLDYEAPGEVADPLEPVEDDQHLRNDVTVTRTGGSSGRVVIEDGPLSVLPPEEGGVGIYDETVTLNVAADSQTPPIAGWLAYLGTWDEARYPTIQLQLHAAPHLIEDAVRLRVGDKGVIRNPPAWLPPQDIEFLAYGYTHTITPYQWTLAINAAPARPWTVGVVGEDTARADTTASALNAAVTALATTMPVTTVTGARWIDSTTFPAEFPFDIQVGGEVMTVTRITGTSNLQTFTVSRSVNGVVKEHATGTPVRLATPTIVAL